MKIANIFNLSFDFGIITLRRILNVLEKCELKPFHKMIT